MELYYAGLGDADVGGWHLTSDPELAVEEAWSIPEGTAIGEGAYPVIYASDGEGSEDDGPHATFKISKGGETLVLYASSGVVVDSQEVPELEDDESYMRTTDGGEDWAVTDRPTKGAENRR